MFEKGIKPFLVSNGVMGGGGPKLNPPVLVAGVVIRFLICAACRFSLILCPRWFLTARENGRPSPGEKDAVGSGAGTGGEVEGELDKRWAACCSATLTADAEVGVGVVVGKLATVGVVVVESRIGSLTGVRAGVDFSFTDETRATFTG